MPDPAVFTYDVFISYSHADSEWVLRTLLPRLEDAGLKVCVDARDFRPGATRLNEVERAVTTSRKTLLILTSPYLADEWAESGNLMVQSLDPASRDLRLIPLLKEHCEPPLRIRHLIPVNFADPDDPAWPWTQLLTALGSAPILESPSAPERPGWFLPHPYGAQPNFTGRAAEREVLSDWLTDRLPHPEPVEGLPHPEPVEGPPHPLLILRALGGFGKSALAWHWLSHDVDAACWPRAVWWSFYEGDNQFDSFLRETLIYLGADLRRTPGPRQQADALLTLLRQPGTLLILDGFERALRAFSSMMAAYQGDEANQQISKSANSQIRNPQSAIRNPQSNRDCVSPVAEYFLHSLVSLPGLRGKVLMTTRLRPRIVEGHGEELLLGCCERELTQMDPADAVAFFRGQGIRGSRGEIEAACAPYGYHPLSLRLLAGLVANDLRQPGDIVAARRLDVSSDLIQRQHHVLEQAYESLTPDRRRLLSRIACFRGPVAYDALAALADDGRGGVPPPAPLPAETRAGKPRPYDLDADLHDLIARGLLHRDHRTNRFDLHPIVRRYAYDRLAGGDRAAAHRRLRDYFAAVPPPDKPQTLDDLAPVIELYHHTVRAGQYDEAAKLFYDRLHNAAYYQFGAYQLMVELLRGLFPDGDPSTSSGQTALPRLKDESAQAWALNVLTNSYSLSGQPARAVPLFEGHNAIYEKRGDKKNLAIGLGNLAYQQIAIGALVAAEANLRRRIALGREIGDEFKEAVGHQELGRLLAYRGAWAESGQELDAALGLFEKEKAVQSQGVVWAHRALAALLMARDQSAIPNPQSAIASARRALELADEWQKQVGRPNARDYVDAHWLLGAALRAAGPSTGSGRDGLDEADRHLTEALARCRAINAVDGEADILLDLARVRWDEAGSFDSARQTTPGSAQDDKGRLMEEAERLAGEALTITERSGYVLQGADVHLFLAEIEMARGDRAEALRHAQAARRLAACDGPPDGTYKVAYDEAGALLAKWGAT